ncbi:MAG TPA: glycosyltransferase family 2 protein, partial [Plesiomonas shigelloides]|nr:glycosyltransferase family 2 protein [Plesiomonas shigelloides]
MKFSGLVITFNEEKNIQACLASLQQVCDDIVVVDSGSQDRTCELARAA